MSESSIAVLVSVLSAMVAALALGWNIYRDVIMKANLHVAVDVVTVVTPGSQRSEKFVSVSGTNFGPGDSIVQMIHARKKPWPWSKRDNYVILHRKIVPYGDELPKRIGVGERVDLFLPYDDECLLAGDMTHVGLRDSFGRIHWAPRKSLRRSQTQFRKAFPQQEPVERAAG